jgi:glycosyltransferase involved in cell wall biosynthesis
MPRAVIASPGPPTAVGGVERWTANVLDVMRAAGWDAEAVWPHGRPPDALGRAGLDGLWYARAVSRQFPADADLIVTSGFLGATAPRSIPRIAVFHGTITGQALQGDVDHSTQFRARRVVSLGGAEALSTRHATLVAVARRPAEEVARYYRAADVRVVTNGIDVERFAPGDRRAARERLGLDPEARYALFPGRLEGRKGSDLVGPACEKAGYELLVAGPTDPAVGRGLGPVPPDEMPPVYAAADCVLFPTRYEGCSLAILEAMACGVPVITSRVGWVDELLEAVPDYRRLIVWHDVDDVAARLASLDAIDTAPLVEQALAHVREHNSLEAFGRAWMAVVDDVVAAR